MRRLAFRVLCTLLYLALRQHDTRTFSPGPSRDQDDQAAASGDVSVPGHRRVALHAQVEFSAMFTGFQASLGAKVAKLQLFAKVRFCCSRAGSWGCGFSSLLSAQRC